MSISIDSSNYFNLYQTEDADGYKAKSLQNAISQLNVEDAADEELMEACKGFEAYFIEQMFKEMKKTVHSSDDDNEYMQYFGDMLTEQYAKNATEGEGLGLAKVLYESMKRNR